MDALHHPITHPTVQLFPVSRPPSTVPSHLQGTGQGPSDWKPWRNLPRAALKMKQLLLPADRSPTRRDWLLRCVTPPDWLTRPPIDWFCMFTVVQPTRSAGISTWEGESRRLKTRRQSAAICSELKHLSESQVEQVSKVSVMSSYAEEDFSEIYVRQADLHFQRKSAEQSHYLAQW